MKYYFTTFLIIVLFSFHFKGLAQSSLLWQITGNNLKDTSYVFGTIHMIPANQFYFPEKFRNAFFKCNTLMMEIDLNQNMDIILNNEFTEMNDKSLKDFYSEDEYKLLYQIAKDSFQINLDDYSSTKPLFTAQYFTGNKLSSSEMMFYELYLFVEAKAKMMHIKGLEEINDQIRAIDSIPLKLQAEMLKNTILDDSKSNNDFLELTQVYLKQDIDQVYNLVSESDYDKFKHILIHQRNLNWIPKIEAEIKKGPVFIAIGAGHLGSEFGILNLLSKKGYKTIPVLH